MDSFLDIFKMDFTNIFMGIFSGVLFLISFIFLIIFEYRKIKNPKLFKVVDENTEYKMCEILNFFLSSLTFVGYCLIKYFYFTKMDYVLNSLWLLLGIISANII
ncbi:MAG: hypothetical protein IJ638_02950, partial [Alphaproteobacteria bacterium]|nr:hypothetical protein [Alphaproteobacteria bacterium]